MRLTKIEKEQWKPWIEQYKKGDTENLAKLLLLESDLDRDLFFICLDIAFLLRESIGTGNLAFCRHRDMDCTNCPAKMGKLSCYHYDHPYDIYVNKGINWRNAKRKYLSHLFRQYKKRYDIKMKELRAKTK